MEASFDRMNSDYEEEQSDKRELTCYFWLKEFDDWVQLQWFRDSMFKLKLIPKLLHLCLNGQMSPISHAHVCKSDQLHSSSF